MIEESEKHFHRRRASHDALFSEPRKLYVNVKDLQNRILKQEDTDGNYQITIADEGPKMIPLGTLDSNGHRKVEVRGHYALSNLLQELALANDHGRKRIVLEESRIHENPVARLSRMIQHHFWDGLTRRIDADGLEIISLDPKNRTANHQPRIYVPFHDQMALEYYQQVAKDKPFLDLDVVVLPEVINPLYVKSIYGKPGILSLALAEQTDHEGNTIIRGEPFVVPGGRFNEMYGWDSYFEVLGLIEDGRVELSKSMVKNFAYEIKHYGKILNANRSYYLTRSQPPFFTDMILATYKALPKVKQDANLTFLRDSFQSAIKEYYNVWLSKPRYVEEIGLSRFHPEGVGMPPETEASHFDAVLTPFAEKLGMDVASYAAKYNGGEIKEPLLDKYFIHDRAVRESGHDTTYRLEGKCANICPVDLNCMLYKYEIDIGETIRDYFDDEFVTFDGKVESSSIWFERAEKRKALIDEYCWNEKLGLYFDYDIEQKCQNTYEGVCTFFPMWAGCTSLDKAKRIVEVGLAKFEVQGGLVTGTAESRGFTGLHRPSRQWDYPYGWAPLQMVAWRGLSNYGFHDDMRRVAYRWLYMITKAFVDFNGVVPEKFDVVTLNHRVNVEYGNVGIDFKCIPREGFGWMNSSYKVGLSLMTHYMRRALGALVHPDKMVSNMPATSPTS
eukprot:Partr_v1_DN27101_c0_g1_i3_m15672 putative trehalase